MPDSEEKLKRAIIKEELIALTGEWLQAVILQQFLYWGERVKDFDAFILEERLRKNEPELELTHGWIWKSVNDLKEEIMVEPLSGDTVRRRITKLVKAGWLEERNNPYHKWDRTLQYRPNIRRIQKDLQALGYALEHYSLLTENSSIPQGAESKPQGEDSSPQGAESNPGGAEALPEITTETPPKTTPERGAAEKPPPAPASSGDYLTDAFNGHVNGLDPGIADPSQDIESFMEYASQFVKVYHRLAGSRPAKSQKPKIEALAGKEGADLDLWERIVDGWMGAGWNPRNIDGMIECYERGEVPSTGKNGGPNGHNKRPDHTRDRVRNDTLSDEQRRIAQSL